MKPHLPIQAFLEQAGNTLNGSAILLSFNIPEASTSLSSNLLCKCLSQKIEQGEFSVELLGNKEIVENYACAMAIADSALISCDPDWLFSISIRYCGLGDFLTNLLAARRPFSDEFYLKQQESCRLPFYFSFYHCEASLETAQNLSRNFLDALEIAFDSEFLLFDYEAFETQIIAPVLKIYGESQRFFDGVDNDSLLLFGNSEKMYVFLTNGSD